MEPTQGAFILGKPRLDVTKSLKGSNSSPLNIPVNRMTAVFLQTLTYICVNDCLAAVIKPTKLAAQIIRMDGLIVYDCTNHKR